MSTRDLHEYVPGQYQQLTRYFQEPAGTDIKSILDLNRVRLAGYDLELWSDVGGWVQLIIGTDYTLQFRDDEASTTEGVDIYGGYLILNAAYQAEPLYITGKIVGGYTFRPYRPQAITLTVGGTIPMSVVSDMAVIADTTAASMTLILPDLSGDPLADNCQITIIPKGPNIVTVTSPTLPASVVLKDQAGQFIWGGGWLPVGSAVGGSGGCGVAIGEVVWWPGDGSPDASKLVCDGALYSPSDYPALFGVLRTLYGGDGVSTFGVPNLSGITPGAFGTQDVNGRTKGDATAIGGVREDQVGTHEHFIINTNSSGSPSPVSLNTNIRVERGASDQFDYSLQASFAAPQAKPTVGVTAIGAAPLDGAAARTGDYSRSTELVGRWVIQAYDTVQEVPADPAVIKDWVEKFDGTAAPPASVVNAWGSGLYYLGIGYLFNGTPGRATMALYVNVTDGFNRYALASMDFTGTDSWIGGIYDAATNSFKPISAGTDYTNLGVTAIYRWENMSAGELNPPVDGWDTVYENSTGAASIPNGWGAGTYEFTVTNGSSDSVYGMTITSENMSSGTDLVNTPASDAAIFVRFTASSNTFSRVGTVGNITRIRKFTGLLNVLHSYNATIEEVDTTAGDVAIVLPSAPAAGYQKTYVNIGTAGFKVTGLPDGIKLGRNKSLTVTWGGSRWSYEDVQIDSYTKSGSFGETQRVDTYAGGRMVITCAFNNFATSRIFDFIEPFISTPAAISICSRSTAGLGAMPVIGTGYPTTTQVQIITGTETAYNHSWQMQGSWK